MSYCARDWVDIGRWVGGRLFLPVQGVIDDDLPSQSRSQNPTRAVGK